MKKQKTVSKVLELKEFKKEQLEAEVKKSRAELDAEEHRLRSLEELFSKTSKEFVDRQEGGSVNVCDVEVFSTYLLHLGRQTERQREAVRRCQAEYEKRRQAMVAAYQEHRVIEILHEKIVCEDRRHAERGEQNQADEAYLTRRQR